MANPIITWLIALSKRYAIIFSPGKRIRARGLMPLAAVLPVVIYAYAVQAIVVSRTESRERDVTMRDVKNLARRITRTRRADVTNCQDYARWDEMYAQVPQASADWLKTNLSDGIGSPSFGFDIVLLQSASRETVWSKGLADQMQADISRYGLLEKCLSGESTHGFIAIGRRVFSFAADRVIPSNGVGSPRGMLLVAREVTAEFLGDLAVGTQDKLAFCQSDGQVIATHSLGPLNKLPFALTELLAGRAVPAEAAVENSTDKMTAYGLLPIRDMEGAPAGVIINVTSRASVMATLWTIRHFSIFLMVLCAVIGIAGVSYSRNRQLALRANTDELTGLHNHGYLQEYLKSQVQIAARYDRSLAVLLVDIDHFKYINDTHGHSGGDQVLKCFAQLMVDTIRATDLPARYGGEEFAIVLPETDFVHALSGAERLRAVAQTTPIRLRADENGCGQAELSLTVSAGVAIFPDDGESADELIQAADVALLEAKRTRNTVCAYREMVKTHENNTNRLPVLDAFLRDSGVSAVRPLVAAIEARDPGGVRHSEKTAEFAVAIGRELCFSTQDLALTCKAALLHDVGMIGVPYHLLTKTGVLDQEEVDLIKRHCRLGADILSQSPLLATVAEIVLRHHERYDGTGYPGHLAGEDIPLIARIVAVADSIDAMVSPRSYKDALTLEQALDEIRSKSGKQFDPSIVQIASRVVSHILDQQQTDRAAA